MFRIATLTLLIVQMTFADPPVIVPGDGFSGIPTEPGAVGSPSAPGYDAKVIGFFDVVPWQTFDGDFEVGVVAFHMNGIDRVEFSADGGPWVSVTEMTLNPRTDVVEYWAILRASDFLDGPVTVHAIAYPATAGEPRLMSYDNQFLMLTGGPERWYGLQLHANAGGMLPAATVTVAPGQSIAAAAQEVGSGGTVYLTAGQHTMQGFNVPGDRWLTIAGAPGTTPEEVRITAGTGSLCWGRTCYRNLKLEAIQTKGGGGLWFDDIVYVGSGSADDGMMKTTYGTWTSGIWATECDISESNQPLVSVIIHRNINFANIAQDFFRNSRYVVNTHVDKLGAPGSHADWVQWYFPQGVYGENFVFYNVTAKRAHAQFLYRATFFFDGFDNVAVVNCHIDRRESGLPPGDGPGAWYTPTNHLLLWHITSDDVKQVFFQATHNFSMHGCNWYKLDLRNPVPSEIHASDNHYATELYAGEYDSDEPTFGDPMFMDPASGDYRPAPGSPLIDRLDDLLVSIDADGDQRPIPASVGAFDVASTIVLCPADLNGDGSVGSADHLQLLAAWGPCAACAEDLDGNGSVGFADLVVLLTNWGPCP